MQGRMYKFGKGFTMSVRAFLFLNDELNTFSLPVISASEHFTKIIIIVWLTDQKWDDSVVLFCVGFFRYLVHSSIYSRYFFYKHECHHTCIYKD